MKAWVWEGVDRLRLADDWPDPVAKDGWVVVKVVSAGVCSTDVAIIRGRFAAGSPPAVLGHEICGRIASAGRGVTTVKEGDRVVVETSVGCGKCVQCRTGNKHLCREAGEIGFPPFAGGYAQYVAVPESCCRIVPDALSDDQSGIIEASVCPFGAVYRNPPKLGATVLVQGAGVAGLSFIQAVKAYSAGKVICSARNRSRLANAKRFGADVVVNVKEEDIAERVLEETGGIGVDYSIDAAGAPATIENAVRLCAPGGYVRLYGIPSEGSAIAFPAKDMILRQITVAGGTNNELAWAPLLGLVAAGRFNNADMVTHRFAFDGLAEAIDLVDRNPDGLIKAVVHPWE